MVDTLNTDITEKEIAVMREAAIQSRSGGEPLSKQQEQFMRGLVDDGTATEEELFPSETAGETITRVGENVALGAAGLVGTIGQIAPETMPGTQTPNPIRQGADFLVDADRTRRQQAGGLPRTQRNISDAASLAGTALVPTNIMIGGGKIIGRSLNDQQLRALTGWRRILTNASSDPAKMNAIESSIAAVAGAAGSVGAESGGEIGRVVNELAVSFGVPLTLKFGRGLAGLGAFRLGNKLEAEDIIGRYLSDIFDRDPLVADNILASRKLEGDIPGVKLQLDEATRSTEVASIRGALDTTRDTQALDEQSIVAIQQFAEDITPVAGESLTQLHAKVRTAVSRVEVQLTNKTNKILDDLEESSVGRTTEERLALGEEATAALKVEENIARGHVRKVYGSLGNVDVSPEDTKSLISSMKAATSFVAKGKAAPDLPSSISGIVSRLEEAFTPTVSTQTIPKKLGVSEALAGTSRTSKTVTQPTQNTLLVLNEIDGTVTQAMRDARATGQVDEVRRLGIIKTGIEDTYDSLLSRPDFSAEQVSLLREGKRLRIDVGKRFEDADIDKVFRTSKQGTPSVAAEDVMGIFIRPGTKAFRGAELYNNIFEGSAESLNLVRREFSRRLRSFITESGKINPNKIPKFVKKYEDSIKAFGFQDEFKNIERAGRFAEESMSAVAESRKTLGRTAFSTFAGEVNPEKFVDSLLSDPRKLKEFARDIRAFGGAAYEGFKDSIVNSIMKKANKGIDFGESRIGREVLFDGGFLNKIVLDSSKELKEVLGPKHLNNLRILAFAIGRKASVLGKGIKPDKLVTEVPPDTLRQILGGTRAALRGFVRADFIVMQAAVKASQAVASKARRTILEKAMIDPQYAETLVRMARSKPVLGVMKSLFSPAIASGARPGTLKEQQQDIDQPTLLDLTQGLSNTRQILGR